jgi:hypothetical protein
MPDFRNFVVNWGFSTFLRPPHLEPISTKNLEPEMVKAYSWIELIQNLLISWLKINQFLLWQCESRPTLYMYSKMWTENNLRQVTSDKWQVTLTYTYSPMYTYSQQNIDRNLHFPNLKLIKDCIWRRGLVFDLGDQGRREIDSDNRTGW